MAWTVAPTQGSVVQSPLAAPAAGVHAGGMRPGPCLPGLLLLASCGSLPPPPVPPRADILADVDVAAFPGAAEQMVALTRRARSEGPLWHAGDSALFALELHQGTEVRRWLLQVRVLDPLLQDISDGEPEPQTLSYTVNVSDLGERTYTSTMMRLQVSVSDAAGQELGQSSPRVPRDFLARGFVDACRAMEQAEPAGADAEAALRRARIEYAAESMQSLVTLLGIVARDDTLSDILWQVVRRPSLLSVLWHFGVSISLQPRFREAIRAAALPPHLPDLAPSWVVPFTLTINGAPALYADLLVTAPDPPLHLSGGILGVSARHPDDPARRFSLLLLAASRAGEAP